MEPMEPPLDLPLNQLFYMDHKVTLCKFYERVQFKRMKCKIMQTEEQLCIITQYGNTLYLGMTIVWAIFSILETHGVASWLNTAEKSKKNTTAQLSESWATH